MGDGSDSGGGVAMSVAWAADNELTEKEKADGWKLLFDGKMLNGWKATGNPEGWAVEDGAIACLARGGGYLYSEEQFDDFVLSIDYKIAPRVNSGIFFRSACSACCLPVWAAWAAR